MITSDKKNSSSFAFLSDLLSKIHHNQVRLRGLGRQGSQLPIEVAIMVPVGISLALTAKHRDFIKEIDLLAFCID